MMMINLIKDSSFMVLGIMFILVSMSVFVVYKSIIIYREIIEKQKENSEFFEKFENNELSLDLSENFKEINLKNYPNINNLIISNYQRLKSKNSEKVKLINEKKINYDNEDFERQFAIIATISSVAPYLGLLGTVIGIMNTFFSISESGSVSLSYIAPSIGESLIVTAIGLFVAIPANIIYNNLTSLTEKTYSFYNTVNEEIYVTNTK